MSKGQLNPAAMDPEQLRQYQMHLIMQQQYAMKAGMPEAEFNPLRIRRPQEQPDYQDYGSSEGNDYGEDDEEPVLDNF